MNRKLIARFAFREAMGLAFMAVALFWSAGTLEWWPGWAALALTTAWILATGVVIVRHHPDLLAERLGPRKGAKRWDTIIMSFHGILQLGVYIVAGLDQRYRWLPSLPAISQVGALIICCLGYGMVVWASAANAFFSQIVRVQIERGHRVVTGGPYRYIRHPAYAGGILAEVCVPILLGSWWALVIGLVDAAVMALRAVLEDRTLRDELPGYAEYASEVRYRLVPGVW